MIRNISIISILIISICLSQENRLFYDGRDWNDIRKKSNFIDEVEYKIKVLISMESLMGDYMGI